jgi:hypothetical protein
MTKKFIFFRNFFLITLQQKVSKKVIFNKNINMYHHHFVFHKKWRKKPAQNNYFVTHFTQKPLKLKG